MWIFWSITCLRIFISWFINIYDQNQGIIKGFYGLIIVKIVKKSLMLDYGLSNAIFEPPNHVFTLKLLQVEIVL